MTFFQRYKPKQGPAITADDLNSRAVELERLMHLSVAAPLRLQRAGAGYMLSIDGFSARGTLVIPGLITFCTKPRAEANWPSEVRYNASPIIAGPPEVVNGLPRYNRPAFGDEVQIHASQVGDACLFVLEPGAGPNGEDAWGFMIINEQVAFGPCDPAPQPSMSGGGSLETPTGYARRLAHSAASLLSHVLRGTKEEANMSEGAEVYKKVELDATAVGNLSEVIDVTGLSTGQLTLQLVEGAVGSCVLQVQGSGGGGWSQLPNNDNWEAAVTVAGASYTQLNDLALRNAKSIRVRVLAAGGANARFAIEFYSKRLRH